MQKSLFKLTLMASVILGISACSGDKQTADNAAATDAKAAKTLIYCSEGSPAGFDPAQYMQVLILMLAPILSIML